MRYFLLTTMLVVATMKCFAQKDSTAFRAYLINNEYEVYLRINFYDQNIKIPGQEATLQLINDFGSEDLKATLIRKNDSVYTLRQEQGNAIKVPFKGKWLKLPKTIELKRK